MLELDKIFNEDCVLGMKKIADESVDLIIADPPYNLSKGGKMDYKKSSNLKGMGGNWNQTNEQSWDDMSFKDYLKFTKTWIRECKRILKDTGSMWIFGTYHNIGTINVCLQMVDLEILNEVIWYKRNAFPNLSGRRLTASHENILWSAKPSRKYNFNYDFSKDGDFGSDQLKAPNKQMRTVWDIPNNKKKFELEFGKHPTQKPLSVISRIIELSSNVGDVMLTPFSGSGTECLAAKNLERHYIGFERELEYFELSQRRLNG